MNTGTWFRGMCETTAAWIHSKEKFNPKGSEERMANPTAQEIYEAERCIECGCCIASCATANFREDFLGAAGLNRVAAS